MRALGALALKLLKGLQAAWDILGITLLLLMVVALGVLAVRRVGQPPALAEDDRADHPYHAEAWFPAFRREFDESLQMRWSPFVYWRRRPMQGQYINVDTAGIRKTVQAPVAAPEKRRVFFFGGSTMWGTGQRDAHTIPSRVAASLAARAVRDVEIVNYGETGYVFTQELIQFEMLLRGGARPDLVVFYDGINDEASSAMSAECGWPQNESRRAFEFALGRFVTLRGRRELAALVGSVQNRLTTQEGNARGGGAVDTAAVARDVADCYARTATLVEAIATRYGVKVLYFWQPTPGGANRPLTSYEVAVVDTSNTEPFRRMMRRLNRLVPAHVDSAMLAVAGPRFHNLSALLNDDRETVWLDWVGHLTERANGKVAEAMVDPILRALDTARPAASSDSTAIRH